MAGFEVSDAHQPYVGQFGVAFVINLHAVNIMLVRRDCKGFMVVLLIDEVGYEEGCAAFLSASVKYLSTMAMSVPVLSGVKSISSLIMNRMCFRPFFGGMNFSILSEKKITPILSLF